MRHSTSDSSPFVLLRMRADAVRLSRIDRVSGMKASMNEVLGESRRSRVTSRAITFMT